MKNSILFRIIVLTLCLVLSVSVCVACNGGEMAGDDGSKEVADTTSVGTTINTETSETMNTVTSEPSVSPSSAKPVSSKPVSSQGASSKPVFSLPEITTTSSNTISSGSAEKEFKNAEEMCKDPQMAVQVKQLNDMYKDSGMVIDIVGKGNTMVYKYTFTQQQDADALVPGLKSGLAGNKATLNYQAATIQNSLEEKGFKMIIRYINADGSVIYEETFPR